jgi:hypothetical protein
VSKRGNRDQFGAMVSACQSAGVGVLVDVILNHMTAGSGTGIGGTGMPPSSLMDTVLIVRQGIPSTHTTASILGTTSTTATPPTEASVSRLHAYLGISSSHLTDDWSNKAQIQSCQLAGLADLATETEYVRSSLATHLNDLLSFPGVSGFRIDAAKHVPIADLQNIVGRLSRNPYITSEVSLLLAASNYIDITRTQVVGTGPPIPPSDYVSIGSVILSDSYAVLQTAFNSGDLTKLNGWEANEGVSSGSANVFVATHDSERGNVGGSLGPSQTAAFTMANVFMLAYPFGTPTVLSSYQYSSVDDGAPNGGYGTCSGASGANGFWCQHRWTGIANMSKFRAAVGSAALDHYQQGSKNQIAFGRQNVGFVAINNDQSTWTATVCSLVGFRLSPY